MIAGDTSNGLFTLGLVCETSGTTSNGSAVVGPSGRGSQQRRGRAVQPGVVGQCLDDLPVWWLDELD